MDLNDRLKFGQKYSEYFYKKYYQSKFCGVKNRVFIGENELQNTIFVNNYKNSSHDIKYIQSDTNFFTNLLNEARKTDTSSNADLYLREKRLHMKNLLGDAKLHFDHNRFETSLESYEKALNDISHDPYPDEFELTPNDTLAINYAIVLCNVNLKTVGTLQTASNKLKNLINDQGWGATYPCFYLTLAEIQFIFKDFSNAILTLRIGKKIISKLRNPSSLFWPTTEMLMDDPVTLSVRIDQLLESFINPEPANGLCFHITCELKPIYFKSILFAGYIQIKCSLCCLFMFHPKCYKNFLKERCISDILGVKCFTNSCDGIFTLFQVFDEKLKCKSTKQVFTETKESKEKGSDQSLPLPKLPVIKNDASKRSKPKIESKELNVDVPDFIPKNLEVVEIIPNQKQLETEKVHKITDFWSKLDHDYKISQLTTPKVDDNPPNSYPNDCKKGTNPQNDTFIGIDVTQYPKDDPKRNDGLNSGNSDISGRFHFLHNDVSPTDGYFKFTGSGSDFKTSDLQNKNRPKRSPIQFKIQKSKGDDQRSAECDLRDHQFKFPDNGYKTDINDNRHSEGALKLNENSANAIQSSDNFKLNSHDGNAFKLSSSQVPENASKSIGSSAVNRNAFDNTNVTKPYKNRFKFDEEYRASKKNKSAYVNNASTFPDNAYKFDKNHCPESSFKFTNGNVFNVTGSCSDVTRSGSTVNEPQFDSNWCKFDSDSKKNTFELTGGQNATATDITKTLNEYRLKFPNGRTDFNEMASKFSKISLESSKSTSQTTPTYFSNIVDQNRDSEIKALHNYIQLMNSSLYQAEEANQQLLREKLCPKCKTDSNEFKDLDNKVDASTITDTYLYTNSTLKYLQRCIEDLTLKMNTERFKYELKLQELREQIEQNERKKTSTIDSSTMTDECKNYVRAKRENLMLQCSKSDLGNASFDASAFSSETFEETQSKTKNSSYCSLLLKVQKYFHNYSESEYEKALLYVRNQHGGKLTGLSSKQILTEVQKYFKTMKIKSASQATDNLCPICYENFDSDDQIVSLRCKHNFHSNCIKTWLKTNSVCPICRVYTLMDDEYPPLT